MNHTTGFLKDFAWTPTDARQWQETEQWRQKNGRYRGIWPILAWLGSLFGGAGAAAGAAAPAAAGAAAAAPAAAGAAGAAIPASAGAAVPAALAGAAPAAGAAAVPAAAGAAGVGLGPFLASGGGGEALAAQAAPAATGGGGLASLFGGGGGGLPSLLGGGGGQKNQGTDLLSGIGGALQAVGNEGGKALNTVGNAVGGTLSGAGKALGNAWDWWLKNPNPVDIFLPGMKGNVLSGMKAWQGMNIKDMMADLQQVVRSTEPGSKSRFEGMKAFFQKHKTAGLQDTSFLNAQPQITPYQQASLNERKESNESRLLSGTFTPDDVRAEAERRYKARMGAAPSGVTTPPPSVSPRTPEQGLYGSRGDQGASATLAQHFTEPITPPQPDVRYRDSGNLLAGRDIADTNQANQRALAEHFVDQQRQKEDAGQQRAGVVEDKSNMVIDTGDGFQTTPKGYRDIGVNDPDTAEQFQTLEKMVGNDLPEGADLRSMYAKDPQQFKRLLDRIKDPKKPKLSREKIIQLIMGQ